MTSADKEIIATNLCRVLYDNSTIEHQYVSDVPWEIAEQLGGVRGISMASSCQTVLGNMQLSAARTISLTGYCTDLHILSVFTSLLLSAHIMTSDGLKSPLLQPTLYGSKIS